MFPVLSFAQELIKCEFNTHGSTSHSGYIVDVIISNTHELFPFGTCDNHVRRLDEVYMIDSSVVGTSYFQPTQ